MVPKLFKSNFVVVDPINFSGLEADNKVRLWKQIGLFRQSVSLSDKLSVFCRCDKFKFSVFASKDQNRNISVYYFDYFCLDCGKLLACSGHCNGSYHAKVYTT